jgi:hypothetical protein
MLLEQVKNVNFIDEEFENESAAIIEEINTMFAQINEDMGMSAGERRMPAPGMADDTIRNQTFPADDNVVSSLSDAVKQMVAAKKAMVILNKMPDSASRTRNKSRVMGNLNRIRGSLQRIIKTMDEQGLK